MVCHLVEQLVDMRELMMVGRTVASLVVAKVVLMDDDSAELKVE